MDLREFRVPNDCAVSSTLKRLLTPRTLQIGLAAFLVVANGLANPSMAGVQPGKSLRSMCAQPPKIVIHAPSTEAKVVTKQPRDGKFALKSGWKIQGLTQFDRDTHTTLDWQVHRDSTGSCVRIKAIRISLGDQDPSIWIAPSVMRNECLRRVVMAHELQHVSHHKKYTERLRSSLSRNLNSLLVGKTFTYLAKNQNPTTKKKQLERVANLAVLKLHKPIAISAQKRDQAIDTPAQYALELGKCGL